MTLSTSSNIVCLSIIKKVDFAPPGEDAYWSERLLQNHTIPHPSDLLIYMLNFLVESIAAWTLGLDWISSINVYLIIDS